MTNAAEFSPFRGRDHDIGYLHLRSLAKTVGAFIENIDRQDEDVKTEPMHDHELELWLGIDSITFRHPESKRRDDDYVACVQYGATIMDVANAAKKEPWAILTLLLIEFKESWSGYSHEFAELLFQVKGRLSSSIAEEALRRLSREDEAIENERMQLAELDEEPPIDQKEEIPF